MKNKLAIKGCRKCGGDVKIDYIGKGKGVLDYKRYQVTCQKCGETYKIKGL